MVDYVLTARRRKALGVCDEEVDDSGSATELRLESLKGAMFEGEPGT